MENKDSAQALERILEKTINMLDESKQDIFSIGESSRLELKKINEELEELNSEIKEVINNLDKMEKTNRKARLRLMEVSRDIHKYSEEDIKEAYEKAEDTSIEIAVLREKEEQLRNRRNELEKRIKNLRNTVEKAENLVSKVGVVRDYLHGKLHNLSEHFDNLKEKQNMALKVIHSQEEERKRVAREIHDGPAQSLANLVFRVEVSQQLMDKDIDKAKSELEELKDIVRSSVQEVRKIIYDLRPMSLDDLGLIPTLKRYINKFMEQTYINVELNVFGESQNGGRLPTSHEVTIFRLIQEALNNVYKHAESNYARVNIEMLRDRVNLLIIDNGEGFNKEEVKNKDKYGLISMRERCNLLEGDMEITSSKSEGTRIKISIPIKKGR